MSRTDHLATRDSYLWQAALWRMRRDYDAARRCVARARRHNRLALSLAH